VLYLSRTIVSARHPVCSTLSLRPVRQVVTMCPTMSHVECGGSERIGDNLDPARRAPGPMGGSLLLRLPSRYHEYVLVPESEVHVEVIAVVSMYVEVRAYKKNHHMVQWPVKLEFDSEKCGLVSATM